MDALAKEGQRCLKWCAAIAEDYCQCAIRVAITSANVTRVMFTTAKHKPADEKFKQPDSILHAEPGRN